MGIKKYVALAASATLGLGFAAVASAPSANAIGGTFANTAPFTFAGTGPINAAPFPSSITQYGLSTTVTDVNVTLTGVNTTFADDVDVELVGPNGASVSLISDTCGGSDFTNRTLTFDDQATVTLPDATNDAVCNLSQSVKPGNFSDGGPEQWSVTPTGANLAAFNGINPNGTWSVYAGDDQGGDQLSITGGWSITITTAANAPITIPSFGSGGGGIAAPYPAPIAVSGVSGNITDVDLKIPGLAHTFPGDLSMVLQSPAGTAVKIWALDCGGTDVLNKDFTFDDSAATVLPGNCSAGGTFKTTTGNTAVMPAPAPAAPYGTSLAAFNGQQANGQWKLFIFDGAGVDGGWISANPTLTFKTTDVIPPETTFTKKPKTGFKTTTIIKFASSEPGSTFQCKIDTSKTFKPCSSPLKLKKLKFGKHKIQVRAVDAAGNIDPTPLRGKWKIIKK